MPKKNMLISLIFPTISAINGFIWYMVLYGGHSYIFSLAPILIILFAALSILLTVFRKADTSQHLKLRIGFFALSLIIFELPLYLINYLTDTAILMLFMLSASIYILLGCAVFAPILAFIAELIVFSKKNITKNKKTFIAILLSDKLLSDVIVLSFAFAEIFTHGLRL